MSVITFRRPAAPRHVTRLEKRGRPGNLAQSRWMVIVPPIPIVTSLRLVNDHLTGTTESFGVLQVCHCPR
jgi:hypothetical protein